MFLSGTLYFGGLAIRLLLIYMNWAVGDLNPVFNIAVAVTYCYLSNCNRGAFYLHVILNLMRLFFHTYSPPG